MPDRVTHEDVQTGIWETVMIIDYNKSNNITEEERLASFRESVQRALDEQKDELTKIANGTDQNLKQKVETAEKRASFAKQKTESLDHDVVYMQDRMDSGEFNGEDGEDAALVYIHSSEGTAFKNDAVETVLTVVIYYGSITITTQSELESAFGSGTYLQWKVKIHGDSSYSTIPSSDERLSDDGFTFEISPEDVNVQAVFLVEVIIPD